MGSVAGPSITPVPIMITLRPYQLAAVQAIGSAWAEGARAVLYRLPTGGGKTTIFSHLIANNPGRSVVLAHRSELVTQASLALGRNGVSHSIIGPATTLTQCVKVQMAEFGRSYFNPNARVSVGSVQTVVNRNLPWATDVNLVVIDEAHHCLLDNVWGKAALAFPNAKILGVSATPGRLDGKGLGIHSDGIFDRLIHGPEMRELIDAGYLSMFKIYCPPSDIEVANVRITAGGDYDKQQVAEAVHASRTIVGDVVRTYLKYGAGKRGITFAVDIESCQELAEAYTAAGVPAAIITGETPALTRAGILRKFRRGEILQLVNVEVLTEGLDVPAVELISMARPTASYNLYSQIFGRVLRPCEGKSYGVVLDHVGNVLRHNGPPDVPRTWTLERRERGVKGKTDGIPLRVCVNPECVQPYPRTFKECPYCGKYPEPSSRSTPEQVDGDLAELDAAVLAAMRGEIERIDGPCYPPSHLPPPAQAACRRNHRERQDEQHLLRDRMSWWGGVYGTSISESQRLFFFRYGIDVMSAQALNARDAAELRGRIEADLNNLGVPYDRASFADVDRSGNHFHPEEVSK